MYVLGMVSWGMYWRMRAMVWEVVCGRSVIEVCWGGRGYFGFMRFAIKLIRAR